MSITKKDVKVIAQSFDRAGKSLSFETGKLAVQADFSLKIQMGENELLCSTVMEKNPREGMDFLPLMIDFRDSYSAAGRLGGAAYRRREGRPSDQAVLYSRLVDRALRPMFPKGMINDVVVTISPLALDQDADLGIMCIVGSSLSVLASGIPFDGPVGAAQIGYLDGQFIVNPTKEQLKTSLLNLVVAGKKGSINMIECEANEVPEDILKQAFVLGQQAIDESCEIQNNYLKLLSIVPQEVTFNKPSDEVIAYVSNILTADKLQALTGNSKVPFNTLFSQYEKEAIEISRDKIEDETLEDFTEGKVKMAVFYAIKHFLRHRTLETGKRIDDRDIKEIRSLYCEVGMFPRTHGTGLFRRGDTQVLSTVTLGGPGDYLIIDDMENDYIKQRYMHHYNFPPFSVGDAKAIRGTGRREIGHGRLAEKALEPMIPAKEDFPYTIRVVSDCLGSGGSTSMGSVCGSTLALMDAGVPLKKPVAGIAMGLMTEHQEDGTITKHMVLNDLMATEDFMGDMDFKVAGTREGVTAIQLDTKLKGITMDIVHETITRACDGYKEIMDFMLETISAPRTAVGTYAPKIHTMKINPDKIKEVIGKGGDVINKIIEESGGVKIDLSDDGMCFITHQDQKSIDKAVEMITEIITDLEVGQTFDAKITRVEDYGVFVQLPKKKMGLCHVSQLGQKFTPPLSNHFKIGANIKVTITGIDPTGKIGCKIAS
ncbi:MAG: polyribonucleotide nucleotidyltransferase [Candidatus Absconditabacteria bacterium]|nr:polyribonucleotide nucleotidyltransferase [Candidatus Absconditabacteria bacterium]